MIRIAGERRDSTMMPFENASRSPWFMNWRGRKRSRATIDASRGKSAYAVFAASTRISIVAACSSSRAMLRPPKIARPSCETPDSVAFGMTLICVREHA